MEIKREMTNLSLEDLCELICGGVEEDYDEEKENMNMIFIVKDKNGKDVTNLAQWYINADGNLYFKTKDVDCPLLLASEYDEYTYEFIRY